MNVRSVGVGRVWDGMLWICVREEGCMTGRVRTQKRYVSCHTHLDMSVSRVSLTVLGNYVRFFVSYESIKRELKIIVYYESIKRELNINLYISVGVMKDYKLKLRDLLHIRLYNLVAWTIKTFE